MSEKHLHTVSAGRFFCRESTGSGLATSRMATVGVIVLPRETPDETLYPMLLQEALGINLTSPAPPERLRWDRKTMAESDAGGILRGQQFAKGALPGAFESFVRRAPIVHNDPRQGWFFMFGALAQKPSAAIVDGLYEICGGLVSLIDDNPHIGKATGQLLRETMWGPGGRLGISTSMAQDTYAGWVKVNRAENAKRDPLFGAYVARMEEICPMPMTYTSDQLAHRTRVGAEVLRAVSVEVAAAEAARTDAAQSDDTPRPPPKRSPR